MKTEITRVVLVQNHLEELGGITRFCALLGAGLESRGYQVEIGSVSPPVNREEGVYPSTWNTWELTTRLSPHAQRSRIFKRPLGKAELRRQLELFNAEVTEAAKAKFAQYGPETVVIFTQLYAHERVGQTVSVEERFGRFHLVAMYHNSYIGGVRVGDLRRVRREFFDADKFLSLTAEDAELFRKAGLNNTGYIQNPMLQLEKSAYPAESRRIISLGRYDHQKSLDHLLEAWSLLGDDVEGWDLDLYGEGPERGALEKKIEENGLRNVNLMGTTTQALEKIRASAFSVQSSQYEGQPLALMESCALGIPCVAYNCAPGVAEIIVDGETGILAAANDPYELAFGMQQLMGSSARRELLGAAAREHVAAVFDLQAVLDKWQDLFAELRV